MKMVKSLLLGSAAAILAVAGAQAADLPVKAKPVEYVKVCALYGAGFFYIPGTDTCLKVGGMVRADYGFNAGGSHGQYWNGGNATFTRNTNDYQTRVRTQISFDVRTQTEYGTLRSFTRLGMQYSSGDSTLGIDGKIYFDRAFIQLGGFTFGKTQSFFDAFSGGYVSYTTLVGGSDTGNGVSGVAAYTAQFGNGFTGTVAVEDAYYRRNGIFSGSDALPAYGGSMTNHFGGQQAPEIVGNLRVDQAWGSAQLSAVLHQVRANYYGTTEVTGSPDDKWGFAVQGAAQFKLPWAAGDTLTFTATYSEGATAYATGVNNNNAVASMGIYSGTDIFGALLADAVMANGTELQLTKVFGVNAGIEHYWTPTVRTSVFGSYLNVDFNDVASGIINTRFGSVGSPDWSMYQVGTRTMWSPVRNLDVGLELLYSKFESDQAGSAVNLAANGAKAAGVYTIADQDVFSGLVRVQRNFWP